MPILGSSAESAVASSLLDLGGPLVDIESARSRPYRVLLLGTSIQQPTTSLTKLIFGGLQKQWGYGGVRRTRLQAGSLGGTLDPPYQGWLKQPYSGVFYLRCKGVPASSPITFVGYGDQVVIEWSQESDTAPITVDIDGAPAGSIGTSGAQAFGKQAIFTVPKGTHSVTLNPPASGAFYFEAIEIRDSARVGVEYIDGTLGGSALSRSWLVQSANGSQATPIQTAYGAGLKALFGRTDVDLIIVGFTVNDAGSGQDGAGPLNSAHPYRDGLRFGLSVAESLGTPVIQIVEPAGHYSLVGSQNNPRYVNVKAHQLAAAEEFPTSVVIDQDTYTRDALGLSGQALADRWYQAQGGTPVVVTGSTFTGDFTHPPAVLASGLPNIHAYSLPEACRVLGLEPGTLGDGTLDMLALPASRYTDGVRCLRPLAPGAGGFPFEVSGWVRDHLMSPVSSMTSSITGAGTSDANGKYFEPAVNQAYGLGAVTGTIYQLVLRIGPKAGTGVWSINTNANTVLYSPDGSAWPTPAGATVSTSGLPDGAVHAVALLVSQTAANQNLVISGRIYEAALVSVTSVPVFPAQP